MKQKILIALDDSENSLRAVQYVATHFTTDQIITFFSVIPDTKALCEMNSRELTQYFKEQQSAFCHLENKKREIVQQAHEKAKEILINAGFSEENIISKIATQKHGVARDIVNEAHDGHDIIIIGRRGLSSIKEFLMGSISHKVLNKAKDISVAIID